MGVDFSSGQEITPFLIPDAMGLAHAAPLSQNFDRVLITVVNDDFADFFEDWLGSLWVHGGLQPLQDAGAIALVVFVLDPSCSSPRRIQLIAARWQRFFPLHLIPVHSLLEDCSFPYPRSITYSLSQYIQAQSLVYLDCDTLIFSPVQELFDSVENTDDDLLHYTYLGQIPSQDVFTWIGTTPEQFSLWLQHLVPGSFQLPNSGLTAGTHRAWSRLHQLIASKPLSFFTWLHQPLSLRCRDSFSVEIFQSDAHSIIADLDGLWNISPLSPAMRPALSFQVDSLTALPQLFFENRPAKMLHFDWLTKQTHKGWQGFYRVIISQLENAINSSSSFS